MGMKEIEQELNEVLFEIGIADLFSAKKFASKIKQHFEKIRRLEELKEYVNEVAKLPEYQLKEEFTVGEWNGENVKAPLYKILEQEEGITLDPENFLRLNGERIAYVSDRIIPLKGKKEELKEALEKIVEIKRELSYPEEVYELPSFISDDSWFNPETGKYVHPEQYEEANKIAYDFGCFWKNIDKPIKESEDPFVQALIHLDELPEYDPSEEIRQMQLARELRKHQIKLKLLEELEKTKVYKQKKWKIIPATKLEMNPGYEEFFHNHLGSYSTEEIHTALKELERELAGENKLRIKALRKDFEKREGISRRKKLALILGGLVAGAAGCYIAYELTRDRKPPAIKNLKWEPTRIVNDKVYDISISFVAEDEEPTISLFGLNFPLYKTQISNATLEFIPKVYSHLPKEAFPNETIRAYNLIPLDGEFDERIEEFLLNVTDIKGGREYIVKVFVQDQAGNVATINLTTPYIREFENIAPLDNITVLVPYYVWYRRDLSNWKDGHKYVPLLGTYRSDDPLVISKHIDWATGHGIDVFAVSWTGYEGGDLAYFDNNLKLLLNNSLSKDIKVAILYESPGRLKTTGNPLAPWEKNLSDPENLKILLSDFNYLCKTYFRSKNYFKIQNRPLIYMYDSAAFIGDVKMAIEKLRKDMKANGYEIYLVSDHVHPYVLPGSDMSWEERAKQFDGITSWLGGYSDKGEYLQGSYEEQIKILYSEWGRWAIENNKKLIPCTTPEFDSRDVKWGNPNSIPLERSPDKFEKRLNIIFSYSQYPKIVMLGTFNDFFESTTLEPSKEYEFVYLKLLKKMLEKF